MAFVGKHSQFLLHLFRKLKYCDLERAVFCSQIAKFSSNATFNSVPIGHDRHIRKRSLLYPKNSKYHNLAIQNVFIQQSFMSSDSHLDNLKITSDLGTSFDSTVPQTESHEQVLFTNTSIPDSSREVLDSMAMNFPTDPGFIEPALATMGLGSNYTPVGWVQQMLELLHIGGDMPWWICIVGATAVARFLMFPIFVKTQRNTAHYANYMPKLQHLQLKFNESRRMGNTVQSAKIAQDIIDYMNTYNINPVKNMLWPLAQAPIFISFFLALRNMAKAPVESMKYGGFSWITDLTIPDPYYIMPLIATSTLYIILKVGAESGVRMENMKYGKYLFTAIPIVIFPFCMNFPSAVLFYWVTNNFFTLGLVLLMKVNSVRTYLSIPIIKPVADEYKPPKKKFIASIKESYEGQKILTAIEERDKMDAVRFKKAGTGPIPRTYSYDPTKPRPSIAAATAKARNTSSK